MNTLGSSEANRWRVSAARADLVRAPREPRPVGLPAQPKDVILDLDRTALIVIDMQNDFCSPQGWLASIGVDVTRARAPIEPLRKLIPRLRREGVRILWVNWGNRPDRLNLSPSLLHVYDPQGQDVGLGAPVAGGGDAVLQKDSWGAAVVEGLEPDTTDVFIDKYRMSGFWDTPLDSILRNLGVTTLMFSGVNSDQCVMCTLQDANFLGYDCILLEDCSATTSPDYCAAAVRYNVQQCFGFMATAKSLQQALDVHSGAVL